MCMPRRPRPRATPAVHQPAPDAVLSDGTPLLLTITEAARRLGVSRTTLYRELDAGSLAYKRVGSDRRIPSAELSAFIERGLVRAER